jgi:hypothetical protein
VDGRRIHRVIYLGDSATALRAKKLLEEWRDACHDDPVVRYRRTVKWLNIITRGRGYSRRAQQRWRIALRAACHDPREVYKLISMLDLPRNRLRVGGAPGRPPKAALW